MLQVENLEVFNIAGAVRGMRNPMDSWAKSDTAGDKIGSNDLLLASMLIRGGAEHRKFLRQIFVSVDIVAPLYWWKEFETYKVGTACNSCSTMHKLASRPLTLDDFSCDSVVDMAGKKYMEAILESINATMEIYNKDRTKQTTAFLAMVQMLPASYNQKRTVTLNYENVLNILKQREHHKLPEWRKLCDVFRNNLPYIADFEAWGKGGSYESTI